MTKVLLVEDDNNLREIYEARLAAEGYDIATAKDGEDALAVAKQEKPELIISDVMMPRISGFEMLDILRNTDGLKHTKVIMLTALGQAEDKSRADNLGADRYLVKSQVTLEDIVKAAQELLDPNAGEEATAAPAEPTEVTSTPPPVEDTSSNVPATPTEVVATPEPAVAAEPTAEPITVATPAPQDTPTPEPAIAVEPAVEPPQTPVVAPIDPVSPSTPAQVDTPEPSATSAAPEPTAAPAVASTTPPIDDLPVTPITVTTSDDTSEPDTATTPTPTPPAPEVTEATTTPAEVTLPDAAIVAAEVQSTLQESADVEKQIKEFEAAPVAAPEPVAPTEQITQAEPAATAPVVAADQASTPVVAPEPAIISEPAQEPAVSEPSVSQISGKLVIQPPTDHAGEPDISALVAQEEYQEQTAAGLAGQPIVSPSPEVPATPERPAQGTPAPGGVFMPNNGGSANDTAL